MNRRQLFWKGAILFLGTLTLVIVVGLLTQKGEISSTRPTPSDTTSQYSTNLETVWRRVVTASNDAVETVSTLATSTTSQPRKDRTRKQISTEATESARDYESGSVQTGSYGYSAPASTTKPTMGLCPNCGRVHELVTQPSPPTPAIRDYTQTSTQPTRTYTPRDYVPPTGTPVAPVIPTATRSYTPPAASVQPARTYTRQPAESPKPRTAAAPAPRTSGTICPRCGKVHPEQATPKVQIRPVELHLVPVGRPASKRVYIPPAGISPSQPLPDASIVISRPSSSVEYIAGGIIIGG